MKALRALDRFLSAKSLWLVLCVMSAYSWGAGDSSFGQHWINPLLTFWWGVQLFVLLLKQDRKPKITVTIPWRVSVDDIQRMQAQIRRGRS